MFSTAMVTLYTDYCTLIYTDHYLLCLLLGSEGVILPVYEVALVPVLFEQADKCALLVLEGKAVSM